MQSFDTNSPADPDLKSLSRNIPVCRVSEFPSGSCRTVAVSDKCELALYNVSGEFYATSNYCPHKGAPLAEGRLRDHVIECDWHGWEFDVRTGECLTVTETLETYEVLVEDGWIKLRI